MLKTKIDEYFTNPNKLQNEVTSLKKQSQYVIPISLTPIWMACHSFKKISKKNIETTNVLKIVKEISSLISNSSLRVTSSLLVGLVKIYERQLEFFELECWSLLSKLYSNSLKGCILSHSNHSSKSQSNLFDQNVNVSQEKNKKNESNELNLYSLINNTAYDNSNNEHNVSKGAADPLIESVLSTASFDLSLDPSIWIENHLNSSCYGVRELSSDWNNQECIPPREHELIKHRSIYQLYLSVLSKIHRDVNLKNENNAKANDFSLHDLSSKDNLLFKLNDSIDLENYSRWIHDPNFFSAFNPTLPEITHSVALADIGITHVDSSMPYSPNNTNISREIERHRGQIQLNSDDELSQLYQNKYIQFNTTAKKRESESIDTMNVLNRLSEDSLTKDPFNRMSILSDIGESFNLISTPEAPLNEIAQLPVDDLLPQNHLVSLHKKSNLDLKQIDLQDTSETIILHNTIHKQEHFIKKITNVKNLNYKSTTSKSYFLSKSSLYDKNPTLQSDELRDWHFKRKDLFRHFDLKTERFSKENNSTHLPNKNTNLIYNFLYKHDLPFMNDPLHLDMCNANFPLWKNINKKINKLELIWKHLEYYKTAGSIGRRNPLSLSIVPDRSPVPDYYMNKSIDSNKMESYQVSSVFHDSSPNHFPNVDICNTYESEKSIDVYNHDFNELNKVSTVPNITITPLYEVLFGKMNDSLYWWLDESIPHTPYKTPFSSSLKHLYLDDSNATTSVPSNNDSHITPIKLRLNDDTRHIHLLSKLNFINKNTTKLNFLEFQNLNLFDSSLLYNSPNLLKLRDETGFSKRTIRTMHFLLTQFSDSYDSNFCSYKENKSVAIVDNHCSIVSPMISNQLSFNKLVENETRHVVAAIFSELLTLHTSLFFEITSIHYDVTYDKIHPLLSANSDISIRVGTRWACIPTN